MSSCCARTPPQRPRPVRRPPAPGRVDPAARGKAAPEPAETRPRSSPVVAVSCLVEWLVPGLGYVVLGRVGRAAVAFLGMALLVTGGLALDGRLDRPEGNQVLSYLATFACAGTGAFYLAFSVGPFPRGMGDPTSASYEFGVTFLRAAGLVGYLLVLDVYDVAVGRKP